MRGDLLAGENNRDGMRSADGRGVSPDHRTGELGGAGENSGKRCGDLEPRQGGAQTMVCAIPERQRRHAGAVEPERVGLVEYAGIPVGCGHHDENRSARRDVFVPEAMVRGRGAYRRLNRSKRRPGIDW